MANLTRRDEESRGTLVPRWDPVRMMRDLFRWDPFGEAEWFPRMRGAMTYAPSWEVIERKDAYVFKCDLPGIKEEDLDISLTGNRLTVSGKRESEEREEDEKYYAYERSFGTFTRSFSLPEGIDTEHVNAELKDGVLTVSIPKKPEVQPKRIALKAGAAPVETKGGKGEKAKA